MTSAPLDALGHVDVKNMQLAWIVRRKLLINTQSSIDVVDMALELLLVDLSEACCSSFSAVGGS